MRSKTLVVAMTLLLTGLMAGCNTMHGAGKDIERGGEKIQEQAR
ncbi:entericidin A/B family lipoprotein [Bordetella genomosp. 4]|uniref:Entericidin n=1 Tax=Bordetella genomosp. 4 TaxID=463044 RepID=A0A261UTF5_9BORD|nr:entericidin [Bordetella genomosp. 4]OZI64540.1 entericidin [Bordetella genomosp. 4]